jgi:hypothetical protein
MVSGKGIFMIDCKNYSDTPTSLDKSLKDSRRQLLKALQHQPTFLPVEHILVVIAPAAVTGNLFPKPYSTAHRVII